MFLTAPIAGALSNRVDMRWMLLIGFIIFAVGTFSASQITADWSFAELLFPQVCRGVGLMLCMVTINNLALGTLSPQRLRGASGLFNLTRNLGGAVGLAIINTLINRREDLHLARLHEAVSWGRPHAEETLANMTTAMARFGSDAQLAATKQLAGMVRQQALVMALADVFYVLTGLFICLVLITPLMRRPGRAGGGGGGH
jgi:DHA2 family multidrug resistance protein